MAKLSLVSDSITNSDLAEERMLITTSQEVHDEILGATLLGSDFHAPTIANIWELHLQHYCKTYDEELSANGECGPGNCLPFVPDCQTV